MISSHLNPTQNLNLFQLARIPLTRSPKAKKPSQRHAAMDLVHLLQASPWQSMAQHGRAKQMHTNTTRIKRCQEQTMMGTATLWTWKNAKSRLGFFDKILYVKSFKNAFFWLWEGWGAFADGS